MNLDFSDDQKLLQAHLRRFLTDKVPSSATRRMMEGDAVFDRGLYVELGRLAVLGAAIPEQNGGAGLGHLELCLFAEEFGRALVPLPVASSIYLVAEFLMLAGSEDQKRRWLPKLARGDSIGAFVSADGTSPATPGGIAIAPGERHLSGVKTPVAAGAWADVAIVTAIESGSPAVYLVELEQADVQQIPIRTIDPSMGYATLAFNGATAELLGTPGDGQTLIKTIYDRAAILIAFEQLGGADRALEAARDYALDRFAFGRQIGSFQSIKHDLADLYVAVTLARSNCYYAAWALATDAADLPAAAAAARVSATRAYQACAKANIQVHGGTGFTWASDCHLHYRRSNALALMFGSISVWEDRLIECLRSTLMAVL